MKFYLCPECEARVYPDDSEGFVCCSECGWDQTDLRSVWKLNKKEKYRSKVKEQDNQAKTFVRKSSLD